MHRRVIVVVSAALFLMVSVLVHIATDLRERGFPVGVGAHAFVDLHFDQSPVSPSQAFEELGKLSDGQHLGLMKVLPDLSGDQSAELLVDVGGSGHSSRVVRRYGTQPRSQIRGRTALQNSFPDGTYLITSGSRAGDDALRTWLGGNHVRYRWQEDTTAGFLQQLVRQQAFAMTVFALLALMSSLTLYWLTVRARGRALRVLGGVPAWRIQLEDTGKYLVLVGGPGLVVGAAACLFIGATRGFAFVPMYADGLLTLFGVLIVAATAGIVVMLASSWPSERALATHTSPVASLRSVAGLLSLGTLALIAVSIGPATTAYAQASDVAAQQAKWRSLADQVVVTIPARLSTDGFARMYGDIASMCGAAEKDGLLAFSSAWPDDPTQGGIPTAPYAALVLANQRWLDLMGGGAGARGVTPVEVSHIPASLRESWLNPNLRVWLQDDSSAGVSRWWSQVKAYRYAKDSGVPFAHTGGGDLVFPESSLVLVSPDVSTTYNADFLASSVSSRNISFTGLDRTLRLADAAGIRRNAEVRYLAEQGVLLAEFTAYAAWLSVVALVALACAFVVATLIGALIAALLSARRDFALRLGGASWARILAVRLTRYAAAGILVAALALVMSDAEHRAVTIAVIAAAGLVVVGLHTATASLAFRSVCRRAL